jgi:hypothetical protein
MTLMMPCCCFSAQHPPEEYMTRSLLPPRAWQDALAASKVEAALLRMKHCDMVASQNMVLLY